jgi:hypothetical protein
VRRAGNRVRITGPSCTRTRPTASFRRAAPTRSPTVRSTLTRGDRSGPNRRPASRAMGRRPARGVPELAPAGARRRVAAAVGAQPLATRPTAADLPIALPGRQRWRRTRGSCCRARSGSSS